jgi:hypothetical protein
MGWGHSKILSQTTEPEELIFRHNVDLNDGPRGSGGATIGKTIFTCVYIEKKILL